MIALTIAFVVVLGAGIVVGALLWAERHDEARAELDADERRLIATWAALLARWATFPRAGDSTQGTGRASPAPMRGRRPAGRGSGHERHGDRSADGEDGSTGDEDSPRAA